MVYEDIIESIKASRIIEKGGYHYFVHPLSNGIPVTDPAMIDAISDWMQSVGNLDCDLILAPEAMGIPFAVALSLKTGIPYSVIRKSSCGAEDEIEIVQRTGYSKSVMYISGVKEGTRVVIVDDVISTGGTMSAVLNAVKDAKAVVTDVLVVINKDNGASKIDDVTKVKTLFDVRMTKDGLDACVTPGAVSD